MRVLRSVTVRGKGSSIYRMVFALTMLLLILHIDGMAVDRDLTELSLEDLMNVRVTSAAKKEEKLSHTAAAIYVITGEEIRHSGVRTLADALRLAPGVEVSQISADAWAVSIRGFNALYSNKLLVLIDGRTVYSPVFSGVIWNRQDTLLEDIDRIEVIRGPGASLWGANAVNGVINIITKDARETHGGLVTTGVGDYEKGFGAVRYGGSMGPDFDYRFYGQYFTRRELTPMGQMPRDSWDFGRGGGRADWRLNPSDTLTMEGESYRGQPGPIANLLPLPPVLLSSADATGGNMLLRWNHAFGGGSEMKWQVYYDRGYRPEFTFGQDEDTLDIDFQDSFKLDERNDVVWGGGFRRTRIRSYVPTSGPIPLVSVNPEVSLHLFSGFVQDEVTLIPDRVRLTGGIKLEANEFSGVEAQPTIRVLWTPSPRQAFWAAISRAARTPNLSETSVRQFVTLVDVPFPVLMLPNRDLNAESLIAYELGYRAAPGKHVSFDAAAFYNQYTQLVTNTPTLLPGSPPSLDIVIGNAGRGQTYGGEISATYAPAEIWRLQGSYSLLRSWWGPSPAQPMARTTFSPLDSPAHQFQIRSSLWLLRSLQVTTSLFYTGEWANHTVRAYPRLDNVVEWHATRNLALQFVVENAAQDRHQEFFMSGRLRPGEYIPRSVYGKVTWQF